MAEFCLNCWNELNHIRLTEEDVIYRMIWICAKDAKN